MTKEIYALYDKVAQTYLDPCAFLNEGIAIRYFKQLVNNSTTDINFSPGDFDLCHLGAFDSKLGTLMAREVPVVIANGNSLKEV